MGVVAVCGCVGVGFCAAVLGAHCSFFGAVLFAERFLVVVMVVVGSTFGSLAVTSAFAFCFVEFAICFAGGFYFFDDCFYFFFYFFALFSRFVS